MDGVLRLFEYDPTSEFILFSPFTFFFRFSGLTETLFSLDIASHAGQRLLCRTEYRAGAEGSATLLYAKYITGSEEAKQNGILYGKSFSTRIFVLYELTGIFFRWC